MLYIVLVTVMINEYCFFRFVKRIKKLPPHPNIVAIYSAFTDYMPNLVDSMEIYPDALPSAYNPNGLGRNMTLFLLMKR